MRDEDEPQRQRRRFTVGEDVSAFSIADLDLQIAALREEIERLAAARAKKLASQVAADAFFKRGE